MKRNKTTYISISSFAVLLLLIAVIVSLFYSPKETYSKYAIDLNYTIAVSSSEIFELTAIGEISGTPQVGEILTSGELTPTGATVEYQWQRYDSENDTYTNIDGATSEIYTLDYDDVGCYIRVVATGTGSYTGMVESSSIGPVTNVPTIPLISIKIEGKTKVGETLRAVDLRPSGATASYQWMRCSFKNGIYTNIEGANSSTYTLTGNDYNCYVKVSATGTGGYSGEVSKSVGKITKGSVMGIGEITQEGNTLTAGDVTPSGATVTYQWYRSLLPYFDGLYFIEISTEKTYTLTNFDEGYYFIVVATGYDGYSGWTTSESFGPITELS